MAAHLQGFFTAQSNFLANRQLAHMVRAYRVPLLVYLRASERWHLLGSRQAVMEAFNAKQRGVAAAGVGRLRAQVTSETFSGPDRCQADVMWFYVGRGGRRLGRTHARYYLTRRSDGPNVDMIEFRRIAFPQINEWFGAHSTPLPVGARPNA